MKRALWGFAAAAIVTVLILPSLGSAETLVLGPYTGPFIVTYDGPGSGTNSGGPFKIENNNGVFLFNTFCVEVTETFNPDTSYRYELRNVPNKTVIFGGYGHVSGDSATLATQTDWLFTQWWDKSAVWSGWYSATGGPYDEAAVNIALQLAIWYYEGELDGEGGAPRVAYNANSLAQLMVGEAADKNGDYGTVVLNWDYYPSETDSQSMLYHVPEPSLILLLGIALCFISTAVWKKM